VTGGKAYLRAPEIAGLTGMSIRTIRRWIRQEILPSTKVGGARLVARADLEHLLCLSREPTEETRMTLENMVETQDSDRESIAQEQIPSIV
jgi:excisionase family DNA binding protein